MIGDIEDAILCQINKAKKDGAMQYLKTVATYGGELDSDGLDQVVRSYPAVWVVFGGAPKPKKKAANKYEFTGKFITMVANRNLRDEAATRKGSQLRVGTYTMIDHLMALLMDQKLGLDITPLRIGDIRTLFNTQVRNKAMSVFAIEWETTWTQCKPESADLKDLLAVGLNYYLTPGDDEVDASDMVTLGGHDAEDN